VGAGVGKPVDPDQYNENIDDASVELMGERLARRIPPMSEALSQGGWSGLYDMTPDEKCIVGALPIDGLYVNAGHSGTGFKIAPALGLCLSEMICDGKAATVDLAPFRWTRFAENQPLVGEHPYSTSWHTGKTK
jgi:sarcosine oxidase subunit beta